MSAPTTSLTFLFTDLESSTQLWERYPEAMEGALAAHDAILRSAVEANAGDVVKTTGDGLMAVFAEPLAAVRSGLEAQRELAATSWGDTGALKVRIGIHRGESAAREGDYFGPEVNRTARIMAAGHGGQILLSAAVAEATVGSLPRGVELRDLGQHRLRDLAGPQHLYQMVAAGLPDGFPPLTTLDVRPNNLPSQTSAFFGREEQLTELRTLLDSSEVRLTTLTGPGGTGKTRLALQAAADQIDRFADGVFFVDLAPQRDPDTALSSIIRTIGRDDGGDKPPLEILKQELRDKRLLLLLDNFEQVTQAATSVADLIQSSATLEILVTSREPLHVRGERLFPVPPLSLPPSPNGTASLAAIAQSEAVQLFCERGSAVQPGFDLTAANAGAVAAICIRVDGLPLALELAAARLRLFTADDLKKRLETRLDLLRGGARDLPDRQQTLERTIEWSIDLLTDDERRLLALFSVFSGATFDAVEQVIAHVPSVADLDVIEGLESLVDKSLVRRVEGASGATRFRMLGTIREYCKELLTGDSGFAEAAARAHAEHYVSMAVELRLELVGGTRGDALDRLEDDLENLELAWAYWREAGGLDQLNELLDTLWTLHDARGWYSAVIDLANDLLGVLGQQPGSPQRYREEIALQMSVARASMAVRGYTAEVEERFNRALELTDAAGGGIPERFPVLRSLASLHVLRSEFDKGLEVGRELLTLAGAQDDPVLEMEAHYVFGANSVLVNDFETGLEHLDRAIELFDPRLARSDRFRLGPNPAIVSYTTSAFAKWWLGYPAQALERGTSSIAAAEALGHPSSLAYAHHHVGLLHMWRQDFAAMAERAASVLQIANAHDYPIWRSLGTIASGLGRVAGGDVSAGLGEVERGIDAYEKLETPPAFLAGLYFWRVVANLLAGRAEEAVRHAAEVMYDTPGEVPQNPLGAQGHVLMGDALLRVDPPRDADAMRSFELAYDIAVGLETRMPQLQAATRLAEMEAGTIREADARDRLAGTYEWFTEGFDEVDLVRARGVLDTLAP